MKIEAHGAVIVYGKRLLTYCDKKGPFYKIPGGKPNPGENGIQTALRELQEETGLRAIIGKELSTQFLSKNPKTGESQEIKLHHYRATLEHAPINFDTYDCNGHEVRWLEVEKIKSGEYNVAPNIKFLLERGELE